ncbi:MAG: RNA polymerase sigma factor [Chloroflexaceae bacterium]
MTRTSNDTELIRQAKSADPHALTAIYERHASGIYRYIYYRIGHPELAEDLCAEVFLRMLEGITAYEDRGWSLATWLYRIARDRTTDVLRRYARSPLPLDQIDDICDGPETLLATQSDHEEIRQNLQYLTYSQQQVIRLRFVDELSVQEVAQRLGRTEGSVKQLQYRGLQSLAHLLQSGNPGMPAPTLPAET